MTQPFGHPAAAPAHVGVDPTHLGVDPAHPGVEPAHAGIESGRAGVDPGHPAADRPDAQLSTDVPAQQEAADQHLSTDVPADQEAADQAQAQAAQAGDDAQQAAARSEGAPANSQSGSELAEMAEGGQEPSTSQSDLEQEPSSSQSDLEQERSSSQSGSQRAGDEVGGRPGLVGKRSGGSSGDPASWGRVGADGTVYVRTQDGERAVGAFPDAPAEQALAFFTRKYEDLAAQVDLLAQRVAAGRVRPPEATGQVQRLRDTLAEADAVGDLDALRRRLDEVAELVSQRRAAEETARHQAREAARQAKERLVAEAETLARSDQWKAAGDRFRQLVDEWRAAPRLDRRTDDALWGRLRAARGAFDRRRRAHFTQLEADQQQAALRKERIVAEAESLASSTDWAATAARFRDLMNQWKTTGRPGRAEEQHLWERFRAAQDTFFAARSATFAARDAAERENLTAKEALAAEAEALLPITNLTEARAKLRDIQDRWEQVGRVPRGEVDRIEGRLRHVAQEVRAAGEREWRRTDPAARARAADTVQALERSIADLDRQLAAARQSGDDKAEAAAQEALDARRSWLEGARRTLADLSR